MRSGNAISPMPHRGPDASQRKSLAIVVKLIARGFSAPAHMHWDQFVCCRALYSTIPAPGWRSPRWHSCWLNCQRPSENIEDKLSGKSSRGICGIVLPIVQAFYSNKIKRRLDDYRKTFRGE